jgi:Skp family chaperone for outer membrane proteins
MKKIEEIAEREGYSFIFDKQALLYAAPAPELDLTELVISQLNKEYEAEE